MIKKIIISAHCIFLLGVYFSTILANEAVYSKLVYPGSDGKLNYKAWNKYGDRLPDYSHCGYKGGGVAIPHVPVKITLSPQKNHKDRKQIQNAIDKLAKLPLGKDGFRGTILLKKGKYHIDGSIIIKHSGIVIRGEGTSEQDTVLLATATKPGCLFHVKGPDDYLKKEKAFWISDSYVPVASTSFNVESTKAFEVGDMIHIQRNTNQAWIKAIGADKIKRKTPKDGPVKKTQTKFFENGQWWKLMPWPEGMREVYERKITAINQKQISIDIPLTEKFESKYGGGTVQVIHVNRLQNIGFENFRMVSVIKLDKQNKYLRNHFDEAIKIHNNVEDTWIRNIHGTGFYSCAFRLLGNRSTIEDCYIDGIDSKVMKSGGYYGGGAYYVDGPFNLVQRCFAINVRHYGYIISGAVPGPNVILDCDGKISGGCAETHARWSTGVLWDNMGRNHPTNVGIFNRGGCGSGHGWTASNSTLWNCVGDVLFVQSPPTTQNWGIGCVGKRQKEKEKAPDHSDSYEHWGQHVKPVSLYLAQLKDRLGPKALENIAKPWQIEREN